MSTESAATSAKAHDRGVVRVEEAGDGRFTNNISAGGHLLHADEPVDAGGADRGPTPYELVLAGLGACTSITLRMYADRKGWPLQRIAVDLRHEKIHAEDCTGCETENGSIDRIQVAIDLQGPLDEEQRARLLDIAHKCPVHRTLQREVDMPTRLRSGEPGA